MHTPEYLAEITRLNEQVTPVECSGQAGDIVFWHHRTAHMAGHNYTSVMRQAVLADFGPKTWIDYVPQMHKGTCGEIGLRSYRIPNAVIQMNLQSLKNCI